MVALPQEDCISRRATATRLTEQTVTPVADFPLYIPIRKQHQMTGYVSVVLLSNCGPNSRLLVSTIGIVATHRIKQPSVNPSLAFGILYTLEADISAAPILSATVPI